MFFLFHYNYLKTLLTSNFVDSNIDYNKTFGMGYIQPFKTILKGPLHHFSTYRHIGPH